MCELIYALDCLIDRGVQQNIPTASLQRGKNPPPAPTNVLHMTLNNLMVRLM